MNELVPSVKGNNGRDPETGRFLPGYAGGPGNPLAKKCNQLRAALAEAVTPDDIREVAATMLRLAKKGDTAACKLLLSYIVGEPNDLILQDRLERLEQLLAEPAQVFLSLQQFNR